MIEQSSRWRVFWQAADQPLADQKWQELLSLYLAKDVSMVREDSTNSCRFMLNNWCVLKREGNRLLVNLDLDLSKRVILILTLYASQIPTVTAV